MKTLKNHTILYDAECPMCSIYTRAFVRTGMLDEQGRQAYQNGRYCCQNVDMQRAVNEIALVNNETGEVYYGVKSLIKVLTPSFPLLKTIFRLKPFVWLAEKLYAFVSYNRRVIIPSDIEQSLFAWQPSFRKDYRIIFLLLTGFLTAAILSNYSPLLFPFLPQGFVYREYFVCFGQIIFQGVIAVMFFRERFWDYLGNMMTISFAGALMLFPIVVASKWLVINPLFALGHFSIVVSLMLIEHVRRSKLMHIGWLLTMSWIFYRVAILLIILKGQL